MCTNQQVPNLNVQPFPSFDPSTGLPVQAFQLQILPDGDVLVADSNADILLDPNGNVLQTYTCASLPGCQGSLFAISLDPDGTSFWTGDSTSGDIWQVDIAIGQRAAADRHALGLPLRPLRRRPDRGGRGAPGRLGRTHCLSTIQPVSGQLLLAHAGLGRLDQLRDTGTPIANEPVTFTLNGSETCTADTDSTGTATCVITPGEPSSSYTLTASFSGDTSTSTPEGSDSTSSTFTVTPDTSSVTYTGPTTAVNGQPTTLSGTLTTDTPTTGHPAAHQGGDLHHRLGLDGAVLQRHHGRQRERQLHHRAPWTSR